MDDILDVLVAHGVPGATIVRVARLITQVESFKAELDVLERQRAAARERMKAVRERSRTHANSSEHVAAIYVKEEKVSPKEASKKVRKKENKHSLPEDWQPKGPQRDPTEADEFRDNARAKAWAYADWDSAYRNFQRSQYNARNKSGGIPATVSDNERRKALEAIEEHHRQCRIGGGQTNGKKPEAGVWPDTGMGETRPRIEGQLRLAGGSSHGDAVEVRQITDAISAVARNLRAR